MERVRIYAGAGLAAYHFGASHPFGPDRQQAFLDAWAEALPPVEASLHPPVAGTRAQVEWFHDSAYVDWVIAATEAGEGYLDAGDTPAAKGIYEAALNVVGTVVDGVDALLRGEVRRVFVPIAGLHHARRDRAAGFCVFNDCGVAIEYLKRRGLERIAYVDIDVHHGDGVYYAFESDPGVIFADIHESPQSLYPGTGQASEHGTGAAVGTKLNLPLPAGADDKMFREAFAGVEALLHRHRPQFVLFQCGADGLVGDPIAHLRYSEAAHRHATTRLLEIAEDCCGGRLLALGGGGYDRGNLARAWLTVVEVMAGV